jgi:tryptophan synthase beta chain
MYDPGNTARLAPLVKMYTLGHDFIPPSIHAGGFRYHGMALTLCLLVSENEVDTHAYNQVEVFDAARLFAKTEGIIPDPEPAHGLKAAIDEAIRCRETGEAKTILFMLCGHSYLDMQVYDDYLSGKLPPYEYPEQKVQQAIQRLKQLYPWLDTLPY